MAMEKQPNLIRDHTIIDTDIHLSTAVTLPDDIEPYVDEPYLSRIRKHNSRPIRPSDGFDRSIGGKIDDNLTIDGPEQIQDTLIEAFGVDIPIFNATHFYASIPRTDVAIALMSAYNDWLLDTFLDDHDDWYGLLGVAPQKPDKAAEEIDRVGDEDQIVGVYLRTSGPNKPLGDPSFDVIYDAAQSKNLGIGYHGGASDFPRDFPKQYQSIETFLTEHTLAHAWSQMLTLTSIIVQGVPEKFPDLEYVFMEAGLGWATYLISRLNMEYKRRRSEAPLLNQPPEAYIREKCYFTQQPLADFNNPAHLANTLEIMGPESIVFSTDYPHWDFDHTSVLNDMLETNFPDPSDRRKILSENAASAFNISY